MSHVFISYSHADKDFVVKLIEYCQIENIDVWWDDGLNAGESWTAQIDEAITNAFGMILIISPSSSVSPYVTYEWAFAKGLGKKIIPVLCKSVNTDTQLETEIDTIKQKYGVKLPQPQIHPDFRIVNHYIDLSGQNNTLQNWRKLLTQIRKVRDNFLLDNLSPKAPEVVKNAYKNFFSPNGTERENAVLSLSLIESPYAEDALILGLDCDYPDVRYLSAEKLGNKRSIKAIPALIKCVSDKNDEVRLHAVEALIEIGDESIVSGLIQALEGEDYNIKHKAIEAVGNLKIIEAIPILLKLIEDKNFLLNEFVIRALGKIESTESVPSLIDMLQHENPHIRKESAKALGNIRDKRAIPYLVYAHKDSDGQVVKEVESALQKIELENIPDLLEIIKDRETYDRYGGSVILILRNIGEKAVNYLLQDFQHAESYKRKVILDALRGINTPEAQEAYNKYRR